MNSWFFFEWYGICLGFNNGLKLYKIIIGIFKDIFI